MLSKKAHAPEAELTSMLIPNRDYQPAIHPDVRKIAIELAGQQRFDQMKRLVAVAGHWKEAVRLMLRSGGIRDRKELHLIVSLAFTAEQELLAAN